MLNNNKKHIIIFEARRRCEIKKETIRILKKIKSINHGKMNQIVDIISKNNNKSKLYIKFDIFKNFLKRGIGYTDYFRGDYINLTEKEKDTFVTSKSFYRIIHYLNNYDYISIFHDKLIFNRFFEEYIKRDYLNLKKCSIKEFKEFLDKHKIVFAKNPLEECGHGIEKIEVNKIENIEELYHKLKKNKQYLIEEEIVQSKELNEINPNVVNSFRVVTLVHNGEAYILSNALRVNQDETNVIGCTNDLYFSFSEDGTIDSNVIDDYGNTYEEHPLTKKKFSEVCVKDVKEAFEMCRKAALEVPEVRYVGWDVGFSEKGPVIIEGNEYPGYGILQFYKLKNERTGHLKQIQDIIGDEVKRINVGV